MRSYVGGPFDGRRFATRHDDAEVITLEYPDVVDGKVVTRLAQYELKCGMRVYIEPVEDKDGQG